MTLELYLVPLRDFNPTLVQFKQAIAKTDFINVINFNPTLVQFKLVRSQQGHGPSMIFQSYISPIQTIGPPNR